MIQAESDPIEEKVRKLAAADLSTRKIADLIDVSQSTVSRVLRKINTGPQPVLNEEGSTSGRWPSLAVLAGCALGALFLATFIVLTAAVATIAWR